MDLLPIRPVKFDWALNTGQIGWKFTENTLYASLVKLGRNSLYASLVELGRNSLYASLVELGIIPMNSTDIYRNGFTPNLTSRI